MNVSRVNSVRLAVTILGLMLHTGCDSHAAPEAPSSTTSASHRQELGKLKYQRDKLRLSLSRLDEDRAAIVARMKQAGIDTGNLAQHPDWRVHAQELKDVVGRIRQLESSVAAHDQAITRMEVILRKEDREDRLRESALTVADLDELSRITHDLDDRLSSGAPVPAFEDLELESLLKEELTAAPLD